VPLDRMARVGEQDVDAGIQEGELAQRCSSVAKSKSSVVKVSAEA
jgi:hypothetical protein